MPEPVVEIPNRPAFRASEVCDIAQIPPYVLKSWEKEFPNLGTAAKPGGPRVYRRADVEQVVRIKHMLFAEGLTLAGARRKLEGEPKADEEPLPDPPVAGDVRDKVARIKRELRSLLDLLSAPAATPQATAGGPGEKAATPGAAGVEVLRPAPKAPETGENAPQTGQKAPETAEDAPETDQKTLESRQGLLVSERPSEVGERTSDLPLLDGVAEDPNPPSPSSPAKARRSTRRTPRRAADAP